MSVMDKFGNVYVIRYTWIINNCTFNTEHRTWPRFKLSIFPSNIRTRERLLHFLGFLALLSFPAVIPTTISLKNFLLTIYLSRFCCFFMYLNYKIFIIANSKHKNERVAALSYEERNREKLNSKNHSTSSVTVACWLICCCPQMIKTALELTSETFSYSEHGKALNTSPSTFNCIHEFDI